MDEFARNTAISEALAAENKRDWERALHFWTAALSAAPADVSAIVGISASHLRLRRFQENDAFLCEALKLIPEDVSVLIEYARTAEQQEDWTDALLRWQWTVKRYPDDPEALRGLGKCLRSLGRLDEAETILSTALERDPERKWIAIEHARVAEDRNDWRLALSRWSSVSARFPDVGDAYMGIASALEHQGRFAEGEAALEEGRRNVPGEVTLAVYHAQAAERRNDWRTALERWSDAVELSPEDQSIAISRGFAKHMLDNDRIDTADFTAIVDDEDKAGMAGDLPANQLFMCFESLGSGCEFGVVQRHFGAEPLALFRWAAIDPADLVRGLIQKFDGLASESNIELSPTDDRQEYYLSDKTFNIGMHTFIPVNDGEFPRILQNQRARINFLLEKILADLHDYNEKSKIFVYKHLEGSVDHEDMVAIYRALRSFGPHTVLFVQLATGSSPNGHVEWLDDGMLVGYISRLCAAAAVAEIDYLSWKQICAKAYDMASARRAERVVH